MAMFVHAGTLAGVVLPFRNLIGPPVIWLVKRDESAFVDSHGRAALNFRTSLSIYMIVSPILVLVELLTFDVVVTVVALIKAGEGKEYRYPPAIPLLNQGSQTGS